MIGVTVVLLKCYYRNSEFLRVGFYVNNEYDSPELQENPPSPPDVNRIVRNILAAKPRITTFPNRWDNQTPEIEEIQAAQAEMVVEEGDLLPEEDEDEDDEEEDEDDEDDEDDEEDGGENEAGGEDVNGEEDIKDEKDVIEMEP